MTNTIENKLQFYAQYWGQSVMHNDNFIWRTHETMDAMLDICRGELKGWYAKLKHLTDITDEDAIEVAKIIFNITDDNYLSEVGGTIIWSLFEVGHPFPINTTDAKEIDAIRAKDIIRIVDYLRSRGYLLPFMGLTTEQILAYKWAVIK